MTVSVNIKPKTSGEELCLDCKIERITEHFKLGYETCQRFQKDNFTVALNVCWSIEIIKKIINSLEHKPKRVLVQPYSEDDMIAYTLFFD